MFLQDKDSSQKSAWTDSELFYKLIFPPWICTLCEETVEENRRLKSLYFVYQCFWNCAFWLLGVRKMCLLNWRKGYYKMKWNSIKEKRKYQWTLYVVKIFNEFCFIYMYMYICVACVYMWYKISSCDVKFFLPCICGVTLKAFGQK